MILFALMEVAKIEQSVRLTDTCESCGRIREGWLVQLNEAGNIRWHIEWECPGHEASHDWTQGPAPAYVRDLIIAEHGAYCLKVSEEEAKRSALMKVFREVFGASVEESKNFSQKATDTGHEGTRVEVKLLQALLRARGIHSDVNPGSCE